MIMADLERVRNPTYLELYSFLRFWKGAARTKAAFLGGRSLREGGDEDGSSCFSGNFLLSSLLNDKDVGYLDFFCDLLLFLFDDGFRILEFWYWSC